MTQLPSQLAVLEAVVGQTVAAIGLIQYVYQDVVDDSDCFLQLTMKTGSVVLLSTGQGGELVRVDDKPWEDPFAEPLDDVNREYVRTSGKWPFFDVSTRDDMAPLIGEALHEIRPIVAVDRPDRLRGVQLHSGATFLNYFIEWDEAYLTWGQGHNKLREFGFVVI